MKIRHEIEELNAKFEHLQARVDRLRDEIYEKPDSYYLWERFVEVVDLSHKYDSNSKEWRDLTKIGWKILDKWSKEFFKEIGG